MKKLVELMCVIVVMGLASTSFALDPVLIGDFETIYADGWNFNPDPGVTINQDTVGATVGTHSLKVEALDGNLNIMDLDVMDLIPALTQPNALIGIDMTNRNDDSSFPGWWAQFILIVNCDGYYGEDYIGIPINWGLTTYRWEYAIPAAAQAALEKATHANIGLRINSGGARFWMDNIQIYPDLSKKPHDPSVSVTGSDVTFNWNAAEDPNDASGFAVNPDIVDQYVFLSTGTDPNLFYIGATGADPGTTDPASQYVHTASLANNSTYYWAVVEAMDGYAQSFSVGDNISLVDPNNIIGATWSFDSLATVPTINAQPVNTRFAAGDASVQLTVAAVSPTTLLYQWFKSADMVIDGSDTAISGAAADTLTITSHDPANQAYYYCRLANDDTVSGSGAADDVYTDVVWLIDERMVAEYLFDGNLTDTSASGLNGTGVGAPAFVAGVDGGSALSLNGTSQYVTVTGGYPNAGLSESGGIGGGRETGTISCWVQLGSKHTGTWAPIVLDVNGKFGFEIEAWDASVFRVWNDGDTGRLVDHSATPTWEPWGYWIAGDAQWHMLVQTWDMNTATANIYWDGNLVSTADLTLTTTFTDAAPVTQIGAYANWSSYLEGLIDNLRIYNYQVSAEDIVEEYYAVTGDPGCIYTFDGDSHNAVQLGSSYCKIDLADFADLAANWLNSGYYTPVP